MGASSMDCLIHACPSDPRTGGGIGYDNESCGLKVISTRRPLCCSQQTFDQLVLDGLRQKVASRTALSSQLFELCEHGFRFVGSWICAHELKILNTNSSHLVDRPQSQPQGAHSDSYIDAADGYRKVEVDECDSVNGPGRYSDNVGGT